MSIIETFLAFLKAADAVTIDDGAMLTDWETEECTGAADNQVAHFSWTDGDCDFSCVLDESGLAAGVFDSEGKFVCEDHEGEKTVVRFFKVQRITSV